MRLHTGTGLMTQACGRRVAMHDIHVDIGSVVLMRRACMWVSSGRMAQRRTVELRAFFECITVAAASRMALVMCWSVLDLTAEYCQYSGTSI